MRIPFLVPHYRKRLLAGGVAIVAGLGVLAVGARVLAQDQPTAEAPSETPAKHALKKKRRVAPKPSAQDAGKSAPQDTAKEETAAPATKVSDAKVSDAKPPFDFAAQLDRAGAAACRTQLNALAVATMGSVQKFNTVSAWSQAAGDKRAVSIAIGQQYADGNAVPFGATEIIAAPNQQGSCDGFSVQVIPSPLSCTKLRESMAAQRNQQLGDLVGIPIMQDGGGGRTMLVPTKADACVLIATRTLYAK